MTTIINNHITYHLGDDHKRILTKKINPQYEEDNFFWKFYVKYSWQHMHLLNFMP